MKIDKKAVYGVYVHIPFCLKKCSYCDFASYPGLISRADSYLENVYSEMKHYHGCKADTVYIGGGTPTCLSVQMLSELLDQIKHVFNLEENCEITVECNPKTVDIKYLRALKNAGVNRLSIGVQSFNDAELAVLGRIHSASDAINCVQMAKDVGFTNLSIDLMFGLPNQSISDFENSIDAALSLDVPHISCYSLIVEYGTPMYDSVSSGKFTLPDEELERAMYHLLISRLKNAGYKHYEISNFAKDAFESRHNNKYWERKPYIGLGAAAHSHIGNVRFGNSADLSEYSEVAGLIPPARRETEHLSIRDEMAEYMFLGLRRMCGISKAQFKELFNVEIESVYSEQINKFCSLGLLKSCGDYLHLTEKGIDLSNTVFCEFL